MLSVWVNPLLKQAAPEDGVGPLGDMGNAANVAAEPEMGNRALGSGPSVLSPKRKEREIPLSWKVWNNLCVHCEDSAGPLTV